MSLRILKRNTDGCTETTSDLQARGRQSSSLRRSGSQGSIDWLDTDDTDDRWKEVHIIQGRANRTRLYGIVSSSGTAKQQEAKRARRHDSGSQSAVSDLPDPGSKVASEGYLVTKLCLIGTHNRMVLVVPIVRMGWGGGRGFIPPGDTLHYLRPEKGVVVQ